jgi:hypothetical protein
MAAARKSKRAVPEAPPAVEAAAVLSIIDVCSDPDLFGPWFKDVASWAAWFAFLKVIFGLLLSPDELELFQRCTGRHAVAAFGYLDACLIIGRRGGKSLILALIAAYLACFHDWAPYLTPGERGTIMIVAADRRQARTIFRYLRGMLSIPLLAGMIGRETADAIDLTNSITIEIQTASFRTVRGYTIVAALADELAFWRSDESANPDVEIIAAIRPAMATIPGSMFLRATSPYAKRGAVWDDHRRHFGKNDSPTLVWQADTRTMNPSVPESVIAEAYERDPANAEAEFGAKFRSDVETFIAREVVDKAVVPDRHELPRIEKHAYVGFVDPSGGSADSMTISIAHLEDDRAVLDAVREVRPPFSPDSVVEEFATLLKSYGVTTVCGDRYAGEWPRERFRVHGIEYECSEKPKSTIYIELLPILNSGRAELLDLPRLTAQLCSLERRTARGGRDSIDHPPGAHDDVANCVGGAIVRATGDVDDTVANWIGAYGPRDAPAPPPAPSAPPPERVWNAVTGRYFYEGSDA